jgi:hypothetical protein
MILDHDYLHINNYLVYYKLILFYEIVSFYNCGIFLSFINIPNIL